MAREVERAGAGEANRAALAGARGDQAEKRVGRSGSAARVGRDFAEERKIGGGHRKKKRRIGQDGRTVLWGGELSKKKIGEKRAKAETDEQKLLKQIQDAKLKLAQKYLRK
jgi:hypothetical protein